MPCHLPAKATRSCMSVHDKVAVAAIVSDIWAVKVIL